jgi:hypothetical protein
MKLAHERMRIATELLGAIKQLIGSEHGVTLLVHGAGAAGEHHPVVALQTTLPSRKHVRQQIVHVLYQSLLADGVDVDNVGEVAGRELAEFLADT